MKTASTKPLPLRFLSVAAVALLLIVALSPSTRYLRLGRLGVVGEPENTARLVVWEAQVRTVLNVTVVVFQLTGVASFLLASFVPGGRLARRGRLGVVTAMLGLGVAGSLCAWYGSEFALFSGGSMAVFLNGFILGSDGPHTTAVSSLLADAEHAPRLA